MMRAPLTTLSVSTLLVVTCLAAAPGAAVVPRGVGVGVVRQAPRALSGNWTADIARGWAGDDGQPRVQFNLRTEAGESRWGFGIRAEELQGLPPAAFRGSANDVRFSWAREAGTFRFAGAFDSGRGSGGYTFEPSPTFLSAMGTLGYQTLSGEDALRLAVIDVTTAYVRDLRALGYSPPDADQLAKMRIHRVEPDYIQGLKARGYSDLTTDDLVKVRIHKVSLDDIDQFKALGFGGLGTEELVRFRIHRVTPAFVREMREVGFASVTEAQLVRMRIHKVDAQFVRDARADGYAMTTPSDAVDLAIRGPRYTRARKQR